MTTEAFRVPYMRPTIHNPALVANDIEEILRSGTLTKGPVLRRYEDALGERLGVGNVVATANCTVGLVLLFRALELTGPVITPSYTFMATVHALRWTGAEPIFADVDTRTWTLDPNSVRQHLTRETKAIVGVPVFGAPCDSVALQQIADDAGIPLAYDSAHGVGSSCAGAPLGGNGIAEAFSTSPTKTLVSAEGGFITTNDDDLAHTLRTLVEYGCDGSLDSVAVGLNGRLSEIHAAIALRSLDSLDEVLAARWRIVDLYRETLGDVPGIVLQAVREGCASSYKDFTILVDDEFGASRNEVADRLLEAGIQTKKYFHPPVHLQRAYRVPGNQSPNLPVTEWIAERALSLPLWAGLTDADIEYVTETLGAIHR